MSEQLQTKPGPAPGAPPPGIPASVVKKIRLAYGFADEDWQDIEPFFQARVTELQPQRDSQYLKALEIAHCDRDLLEHQAHADRVLALAEEDAVREILKPGYSQHALGSPGYVKIADSMSDRVRAISTIVVEGESYELDDYDDPKLRADLKRLAIEKLKTLGLGPRALKTKAMELRQNELDKIHRRISLLQARRDLVVASYLRESAALEAMTEAKGVAHADS